MKASQFSGQDWGSDTLNRYRYQAEITVPYCLAAALDLENITAVVPEHLEDIALHCGSSWRFIQVKSRNLELGLWTLSQLLEEGGALRSFYRTYQCVEEQEHTLELILEGAPKSKDLINELRPGGNHSELIPKVASSLNITTGEAEAFLRKVVLNGSPPPRDCITACNRELIHVHAPNLTKPEIDSVYQTLLDDIERAMRAEPLGPRWPDFIVHPERRSTEVTERLEAKTLSREHLKIKLSPINGVPKLTLRRLVLPGNSPICALHRKMLDGGADDDIISNARNLQANVRYYWFEQQAQGRRIDASLLEDTHLRIQTHVSAKTAIHNGQTRPANHIWADLLNIFEDRATSIDRGSIFNQDPMLLLGEACDLSDQCKFGWGRVNDAT